jgi:hypothetical protein
MANFMEQLVGEWYEYQGYFVRRNVLVGRREKGGYECELDIVAFHPEKRHLVQIEPSMDAHNWEVREQRYAKKFAAGKRYIPDLLRSMSLPNQIDQIALLVYGSNRNRETIGGGKIQTGKEFLREIRDSIRTARIEKSAVPEQFPILKGLQFAAQFWD